MTSGANERTDGPEPAPEGGDLGFETVLQLKGLGRVRDVIAQVVHMVAHEVEQIRRGLHERITRRGMSA